MPLEKEVEEAEKEGRLRQGELRYKGKVYSQEEQKQEAQQKQAQEQDFYNQAAVYGLKELIGANKRLQGLESTLEIDPQRLKQKVDSIRQYLAGKSWNEERKAKFFYEELAAYSISGEILTTQAQESILKIGLGKKKGFKREWAKSLREGEKYLNKNIGTARYIEVLLKNGVGFTDNKLVECARNLIETNFWYAEIDKLYSEGNMTPEEWVKLHRAYDVIIKESAEKLKKAPYEFAEKHGIKVAASVIGAIGIGILALSGLNITGNVIGESFSSSSGIVSGLLILLASFLLFRKSRY